MRLRHALVMLLAALASASVLAQDWPTKPIRLIVSVPPGGLLDTTARIISDRLSARLGQPVVVDNRPGATGNIGTEAVARAAPDGYTLLVGFDGTLAINPHVFSKIPFDTLRDFAPITKIGDAILLLIAHPAVPASNLKELLAYGKAKPGALAYGTSGIGGTPHLAAELLKQRTGLEMTHIPYKGGGQAIADLIGGSVPLLYTAVASAQQHVKSGKVRALAVSSAKRTAALPEVPTFIESGVAGFEVSSWVGLLAPANTPPAIIERLQRETAAVLAMPEVRERFAALGIEPVGNTAGEFAKQIRADHERWGQVVKQSGIKLD